jgi:hypothetical protein
MATMSAANATATLPAIANAATFAQRTVPLPIRPETWLTPPAIRPRVRSVRLLPR